MPSLSTISAATGRVITIDVFAFAATRRIYFTGVPAASKINFLKRLIKTL
jgi:hypothetical protein